jgi:alpha-beta hydrolase superfamily lysophospholipase
MIVQVHSSGGNLSSLPLRAIARALSARGYAALNISTRQHDEHVNTDNFFEVRRDIEAAVAIVRALGYRFIVLQGHSLGTVQVESYAATDWDPTIKAVILTGAFGRLAAEILPIKMRWLGGIEKRSTSSLTGTSKRARPAAPTGLPGRRSWMKVD